MNNKLTNVAAFHLTNGTGWWIRGFNKDGHVLSFSTITEARADEGVHLLRAKLATGEMTGAQGYMALRKHFAPKERLSARRR